MSNTVYVIKDSAGQNVSCGASDCEGDAWCVYIDQTFYKPNTNTLTAINDLQRDGYTCEQMQLVSPDDVVIGREVYSSVKAHFEYFLTASGETPTGLMKKFLSATDKQEQGSKG